jgi:iron complex outermembrane receptor protein
LVRFLQSCAVRQIPPALMKNGGGLTEVVVTAQRRSESLEHAAIAIDVVSADALSATGTSRASELGSRTGDW